MASKKALLKNVSVVTLGAFIAQMLNILSIPLLTRLYEPDSFGLLSILTVFTTTVGMIAGLRYDMAIVLPRSKSNATRLLRIVMVFSLIMSSILMASFILLPSTYVAIFGVDGISKWGWLISLAVLFTAWYKAIGIWLSREGKFIKLSVGKILHPAAMIAVCFIMHPFSSSGGLLYGSVVGLLLANIYLLVGFANNEVVGRTKYSMLLAKYSKFPKFSTVPLFINTMTLQLPTIFVTRQFGLEIAGLYALALKILYLPSTLISQSISQTLLPEIARRYRNKEPYEKFIRKVSMFLIALGLLPAFIVVFLGPEIVTFILGEDWRLSGEIIRILVFPFLMHFAANAVSCVFTATNRILHSSLWQIAFCITTLMLLYTLSFTDDIMHFLWAYGAHEVIMYSLYLLLANASSNRCRN